MRCPSLINCRHVRSRTTSAPAKGESERTRALLCGDKHHKRHLLTYTSNISSHPQSCRGYRERACVYSVVMCRPARLYLSPCRSCGPIRHIKCPTLHCLVALLPVLLSPLPSPSFHYYTFLTSPLLSRSCADAVVSSPTPRRRHPPSRLYITFLPTIQNDSDGHGHGVWPPLPGHHYMFECVSARSIAHS